MRLTRRQLRQLILEATLTTDKDGNKTLNLSDDEVKNASAAVAGAIESPEGVTDDQEVDAFASKINDEESQNEAITLMKKPMHSHDNTSIVDFTGKPDHEGKMAYKQLKRTSSMAQSLCHRLEDKENIQLPAWVQSKITKAADYIQSVYNYLDEDLD